MRRGQNLGGALLAPAFLGLLVAAAAREATARPIRVLHTNDLHSFFEHSGNGRKGGYAALKATLDRLKAESAREGIEVLALDAGDFFEGSPFYFAGRGEESWRLMNAMGYDAVTIGNHDWLMGPAALDRLVGASPPTFAFLGANFIFDGAQRNLGRYMRKALEVMRGGMRVAVLGLTTDEFFYSWRVTDGFVYPPAAECDEILPGLRARNDLVIALTHLGLDADRQLARVTRGFDLVVGGHSHTHLPEPLLARDLSGRTVPIVQAGEHAEQVGELLLDVERGRPLQILSYRFHPIVPDGEKDTRVAELVSAARQRLEREYGREWLSETIGRSEIPFERPQWQPNSAWAMIFTDAIREAAEADVALNSPFFFGVEQEGGAITREKLMTYFPRTFDTDDPLGWTVWTTEMQGWALKSLLTIGNRLGERVIASNLTYRVAKSGSDKSIEDVRIGGRPLRALKWYKVAVPEGMGRAVMNLSSGFAFLFKRAHTTGISVWTAVERRIGRIGGVVPRP